AKATRNADHNKGRASGEGACRHQAESAIARYGAQDSAMICVADLGNLARTCCGPVNRAASIRVRRQTRARYEGDIHIHHSTARSAKSQRWWKFSRWLDDEDFGHTFAAAKAIGSAKSVKQHKFVKRHATRAEDTYVQLRSHPERWQNP